MADSPSPLRLGLRELDRHMPNMHSSWALASIVLTISVIILLHGIVTKLRALHISTKCDNVVYLILVLQLVTQVASTLWLHTMVLRHNEIRQRRHRFTRMFCYAAIVISLAFGSSSVYTYTKMCDLEGWVALFIAYAGAVWCAAATASATILRQQMALDIDMDLSAAARLMRDFPDIEARGGRID